jgi:hypothetical protein
VNGHRCSLTALTVSLVSLFLTYPALSSTIDSPNARALLLEARKAAVSIKDPSQRSSALEHLILFQIGLDPSGSRELLTMFPDLPNRSNHLVSLAFNYAKVGNIKDTEEMYTEIMKGDNSNRGFARANALGHVAWAYANAGKLKESFRTLSQLKEQFQGESLAIHLDAPARVAEAQAQAGDIAGAIELAKSVAGENPYPLMAIIGERVRANDMSGALQITSDLEEPLQPYGKWGIVTAQREIGNLEDAKTTAATIKPGHAKASALLELADYYVKSEGKQTALLLLREAATAATSTINEWARADILWHVAASTATAGDSMSALKIARSIEKDGHKNFAIRDIVKAQAEQGAFKEAFDTASLLQPPGSDNESGTDTYVHALTEIFTQMVIANHTKEARETAARFYGPPSHRARLYSAIAAAQADLDDVQGARTTLSYAESDKQRAARRKEMARLISLLKQGQDSEELRQLRILQDREYDTLPALEAMALAYARRGSPTEASKIANDLDFHKRVGLYNEIGNTLVASNHKMTALQWARALSSLVDKTYALVGIARAISTSKQKDIPIK